MKKSFITFCNTLGIVCVAYYTIQFLQNKQLLFYEASLMDWVIICSMILMCLIIGVVNAFKIDVLMKQNKELKELVLKLIENCDRNRFSQLHQLQNSNELSLDILDELSKGGYNVSI